ncbi:MAG: hypothetical protein GY719_15530 [bacterium]|nr:hypothetical protein [bacterium]
MSTEPTGGDNRGIFLNRQGRGFFVAGLLELVANERPDLLGPLIEALEHGPAGHGLAEVAEVWRIRPEDRADDLGPVVVRASRHLDRLERRRTGWRHPGELVGSPNVEALAGLADARRRRVDGIARVRRLDILRRKLERVAEVERQRRELDAFLQAPSKPVDLAAFMGWKK